MALPWYYYRQSDNKKMQAMRKTLNLLLWVLALAASGCAPSGRLFHGQPEGPDNELILRQYFSAQAPVLKPGDKITVSVWGNEELSVGSVNSTYSTNEATGRWLTIDQDGDVNLPGIGRTQLAGYSLKEVNYKLEEAYGTILQTPIVNVRVLNHYVTILGEVRQPGRFQISSELVSLVQLLGQAQGLSQYGKAESIRIIRQTTDGPVTLNVDLSDVAGLPGCNVVLQPDDLVYVEASRAKQADENLRRATPIVSILTGIGVLASLLAK